MPPSPAMDTRSSKTRSHLITRLQASNLASCYPRHVVTLDANSWQKLLNFWLVNPHLSIMFCTCYMGPPGGPPLRQWTKCRLLWGRGGHLQGCFITWSCHSSSDDQPMGVGRRPSSEFLMCGGWVETYLNLQINGSCWILMLARKLTVTKCSNMDIRKRLLEINKVR